MFGHDKHKDEDDDAVPLPSTKPVNEGLLGVNDAAGADNAAPQKDTNDPNDPTNLTVKSGADVPPEDSDDSNDSEDDVSVEGSTEKTVNIDSAPTVPPASSPDNLLDIKRDALQALSPLVGHLDQSPEEKFKTTMMMIQASDDQSLIPVAYEAAKQIEDDKERAQALLDIINEINYFTQPKGS